METNFFLTALIGVVSIALICFGLYLLSWWVIVKFQIFIKEMLNKLDQYEEPDESSAYVRHEMTDRLYNEMLMRELRKDAGKAKTLKGNVVEFKVSDGPLLVKSDEIIFMQ
ncbi:MAG: hypothetical protein LLG05_06580 [Porphyromonadaceae bacterium]|nr:hypothetical protein [Porphyromonadaceae bacterium]